MATHEVHIKMTVQMEEMDGTPDESAEVFLNVYENDVRKAVEDVVGSPVVHCEVTDATQSQSDVLVSYDLGFYVSPIYKDDGTLDKRAMVESWADCVHTWILDGVTPDEDYVTFGEE